MIEFLPNQEHHLLSPPAALPLPFREPPVRDGTLFAPPAHPHNHPLSSTTPQICVSMATILSTSSPSDHDDDRIPTATLALPSTSRRPAGPLRRPSPSSTPTRTSAIPSSAPTTGTRWPMISPLDAPPALSRPPSVPPQDGEASDTSASPQLQTSSFGYHGCLFRFGLF